MRFRNIILAALVVLPCTIALPAEVDKGAPLPARTIDLIADVDNRLVVTEFGGDAEAARNYITNVLFAVRIAMNRDLNITLNLKELVVWESPAPFEIAAGDDPSVTEMLSAYKDYVEAERSNSLPSLFQLFAGFQASLTPFALAFVGQPCDGVSFAVMNGNTTFPAGDGSLDVILSARGIGRNLGAATNTAEPSFMGASITGSTPLLYLPESINAIGATLDGASCWNPVEGEGAAEGAGEGDGDGAVEGEGVSEICNDSLDNDENGFTDCDDSACAATEFCTVGHSADYDALSGVIGLSEVLRLAQLYNANGFHCAIPPESTDDGFAPGVNAAQQECTPHSSDYGEQNWLISLTELLRLIQFFNTGGYLACPDDLASEDGYCAGT